VTPPSSLGVSKIAPPSRSHIPSGPEHPSKCQDDLRLRLAISSTPSALVVPNNFDGFLRYAIVRCYQRTPTMGFASYHWFLTERLPQLQLQQVDRSRPLEATVVGWDPSGKIQCLGCAYPAECSPHLQPILRHRSVLPSRCWSSLTFFCSLCESSSKTNTSSTSRLLAITESVAQ